MAIDDPTEALRRALESARAVRLGKGVVAKTGHVALATAAVWGLIVWRSGDSLGMNLGLLGAGLVVTAFAIWWISATQRFAERNPAQAMLEGAEFLEYQKMGFEAKGLPPVKDSELIEARPADDLNREVHGA